MPPLYTLLILFFLVPTSLFAADISDVGTYARYQENVKQFCDSPNGNLWKDWKKSALLKNTNPPFAEITDPKIDDTYKSYLTKIQADAEEIHRINIAGADIATQVDKAAYLYKSNMNALYACAVMNAKVRISEDIVKMIPTANSNIQERLKSTTEALKLRMQAQ